MLEKLKSILGKIDADYADIRYEKKLKTNVAFSSKDLTEAGTNTSDGFVLRILMDGGLATIAFPGYDDAGNAIRIATENARLMAKNASQPACFAPTKPVIDQVQPNLTEDPRQVSLDEKLELTRTYNDIPLKHSKIIKINTHYQDLSRIKYFASTEGSEITEELVTTILSCLITAKDGNVTQNISVRTGGSQGFSEIRNVDEQFEENTKLAADLLKAQPLDGGTYDVILNPDMAGVFTHEAFGHFSEADLIENSPTMKQRMRIGEKIGSDILNIKDDATVSGQLGYYVFDDEGIAVRPVQLLKNGVITGRLHSRRTAAAFDEPISGHCVAEDYRYAPIIRMGNIFIEAGDDSPDEMFEKLQNGLYLIDAKGGQTSGADFTFGTWYGYIVKNGVKTAMIRDVNISGNLYETMKNVSAVGNDLELSKTGGCGKGQLNIKSCHGAPHVLIKNIVVGGA
jgi:TldD protein